MADDEMLAVLKEIRDLQKETLATQHRYTWVLLPIFVILAIMVILGLTGFFLP